MTILISPTTFRHNREATKSINNTPEIIDYDEDEDWETDWNAEYAQNREKLHSGLQAVEEMLINGDYEPVVAALEEMEDQGLEVTFYDSILLRCVYLLKVGNFTSDAAKFKDVADDIRDSQDIDVETATRQEVAEASNPYLNHITHTLSGTQRHHLTRRRAASRLREAARALIL